MKIIEPVVKILVAVVLVAALLNSCFPFRKPPTAQLMIANFQNNKADFERLLQLFRTDSQLGRVAYDFTRPAGATSTTADVPQERLNEYRVLFTKLNLEAGIEGYGDKRVVYFIASTQGLSISGSAKGYAYSDDRPDLVVENIDDYRSDDGTSFIVYQHIEENWYLYFDYED